MTCCKSDLEFSGREVARKTLHLNNSLGGAERHSLGAGKFNRATAASGVKVAQHPKGLTLSPARGGGAR